MQKILIYVLFGNIIINYSLNNHLYADINQSSEYISLDNSGKSIDVSTKCPIFEVDGKTIGGYLPVSVKGDVSVSGKAIFKYPKLDLGSGGYLDVELICKWSESDDLLYKWVRYRKSGSDHPILITKIILDKIDLKANDVWTHGGRVNNANRYVSTNLTQSMPFFTDGFFMGIEFPVSSCSYKDNIVELAHSPGTRIIPQRWYVSKKAVYGIANIGSEQASFEKYLASVGRGINKLHINYNSWWTAPPPFNESQTLEIIDSLKKNLFEPYRLMPDSFLLDDGWMNNNTIWQIDKKRFPNDFSVLQKSIESLGSNLGLWMSPSSSYPGSLDNNWAKSQGYEAYSLPGWGDRMFLCYAAPKYGGELKTQIPELLKKYNMRLIKTDSILMECSDSTHGHEPGNLSHESMAEGLIAFYNAIHKTNPKVMIEPFGLGYDPSPWWLMHTDDILGCQGDDVPPARVPSPKGRESLTTARDYFNLQGSSLSPVPISGQEVVGLVHQTDDDFMNDAVIVLMRGNLFLPLYVNPRFMNENRWRNLAIYLKWAKKNQNYLKQTIPLLPKSWKKGNVPRFNASDVMSREPYGYSHIIDNEGYICLRNPWIAEQDYELKLDKSIGFSKDAGKLNAVTVYPSRKLYFKDMSYEDVSIIRLAPYETIVLYVSENKIKKNDIVRDSLSNSLSADVKAFKINTVNIDASPEDAARKYFGDIDTSAAYKYIDIKFNSIINCNKARVLVLVESEKPIDYFACGFIKVNGKEAVMAKKQSIGIWNATGLPQAEHWIFFEHEITKGKHDIELDILLKSAPVKLSAWIWGVNIGGKLPVTGNCLPEPEEISMDSVMLIPETILNDDEPAVRKISLPGEEIKGVFIDSLTPVSSEQTWGSLKKNVSVWDKPLTINQREFNRGLGTHANSRIVYDIAGKYRVFKASVGQDFAIGGSVEFEVIVDGRKRWSSGIMRRLDDPKTVELDITGASVLELIVNDAGDGINGDHADWADAMLLF